MGIAEIYTLLKVFGYSLPILAGLGIYWFIRGYINQAKEMSKTITSQQRELDSKQREIDTVKGRIDSYLRMIERRDKAIEASQCKDQIKKWISNPDQIPQKWDPFNDSILIPKTK